MKFLSDQISLRKTILITVAIISLFSCKKSEDIPDDTPALHLLESENLVIPAAVKVPEGRTRVATYYAVGVQKYKAQVIDSSDPVAYEWVFTAPEADLYDITNKKVGIHTTGPSWKLTGNIDSIFGQHFSPQLTAASQDANSIDWLLLKPMTGKAASGIFANVSFIQRIATVGGKKPAVAPVNATQTAHVHYTAIYRFTK